MNLCYVVVNKVCSLLCLCFLLAMTTKLSGDSMIKDHTALYQIIGDNPFFIEKEKVDLLLSTYGIEVEQLLQELIPIAQLYARPPISHYHVGVAGLGVSGNIYLGVNLEFLGQSLNQAVHGEQFMVVNARSHGEIKLTAIALSAAPCGHCRQFLYEMGNSDLPILMVGAAQTTLNALLPLAFGPQDLGLNGNLMEQPERTIRITMVPSLQDEAIYAAETSYVPYSQAKSGIAIQTVDGSVYTGCCLENAAYNPSLAPLQAALVSLVTGMQKYTDIAHVVLAESEGSKVSHKIVAQDILKDIAPQATFEVISIK